MSSLNPDPETGYARGRILEDDLQEYKNSSYSHRIISNRLRGEGRQSLYDFIGLNDNCQVSDDLAKNNVRTERYFTTIQLQPELDDVVREHLGGGDGFRTKVFSRGTSGNITAIAALAEQNPDATIPFFVTELGGHPSMARGAEIVGSDYKNITGLEELDRHIQVENPPLVVICPAYRDIMDEQTFSKAINIANSHNIPVFVDDAAGSRLRTILQNQRQAIDLGADVVLTSSDKYGFDGPRAGVIRGRADLMDYVEAKAATLGTEARPGTVAATVRTFRDFDPAVTEKWFQEKNEHASAITEELQDEISEKFHIGKVGAIKMTADDVFEVVTEDVEDILPDLAPIDVSVGLAMLLLEEHGWITVATMGKPGSTVDLRLSILSEDTERLSNDEIVKILDTEFEHMVDYVDDSSSLESLLLGK